MSHTFGFPILLHILTDSSTEALHTPHYPPCAAEKGWVRKQVLLMHFSSTTVVLGDLLLLFEA